MCGKWICSARRLPVFFRAPQIGASKEFAKFLPRAFIYLVVFCVIFCVFWTKAFYTQ
jgi:hypothetical protein